MAHKILIIDGDGIINEHDMAIAEVRLKDEKVISVSVFPFEHECEGVVFHNGTIRIEIGKPLAI